MNVLRDFYKKIKRQYINFFWIKAVSLKGYIFHLPAFFFNYFFGRGKASFPLNITLDLSYDCNLSCRYCFLYSQSDPSLFNQGEDPLTREEITKLINALQGRNTSFFLTGGEPLLNKDFTHIVDLIKKKGFNCGVATNATLLEKEMADTLIQKQLDYLFFSLDGPEQTHNTLRGEGTYVKTCANIEYIIKNRKGQGPKVIMSVTLLPENYTKLKEIIDIAGNLQVDAVGLDFLAFVTPLELDHHKKDFAAYFSEKEFKGSVYINEFENFFWENMPILISEACAHARKKKIRIFLKPELSRDEMKGWFKEDFRLNRTCIYPWSVLRISPCGDIYPCALFHMKMGNIRSSSIEEIWNNESFRAFRRELKKKKMFVGCNRCCKL